MTNISGGAVAGSTARYYPFGDWRTEPTSGLTDIGYTGHRHNNLGNAPDDIGLIYMNARWYLPGLARFISADTLVPNPTNPQSWNRYTYTLNNPVRFSDPSGHCAAEGAGGGGPCTPIPPPAPSPSPAVASSPAATIPDVPMVTFGSGVDCVGNCSWSQEEEDTIQASAMITGTRLAEALNASHAGWNLSASQAFLLVYGGSVNFQKMGGDDRGYWGETFLRDDGSLEVEVYGNPNLLQGGEHWAVHELGHAFTYRVGQPIVMLTLAQWAGGFPNRPNGSDAGETRGFAGGRYAWQNSPSGSPREEFADMYLGWVYNQWEMRDGALTEAGKYRAGFMNTGMLIWANMASGG